MVQPPLTNIQQELLKLYSSDVSEEDLIAIKNFIANYFASKAIKEADQIWDKKGYTPETMQSWLNESEEKYGK